MQYPKRLIEVDLPIKRISAHARREKNLKKGNISALHIWWARRPLAACRAVICAGLWPDPVDPLCPDSFRVSARHLMEQWASDHLKLCGEESDRHFVAIQKDPDLLKDNALLRRALLDFIADFANWDNSTVSAYLDTSRALTHAAHEALGGVPGTRPLVLDPFAGGGSIPLEALRVGADSFASDLNPIPVLLNKVVLEYIPKYGQRLVDEVRRWGEWIKREAEKKLAEFYPQDADGAVPIAYLWARTIPCEGPNCGVEIPLMNQCIVSKRRGVGIEFETSGRTISIHVKSGVSLKGFGVGTVQNGKVTCLVCGFTMPAERYRQRARKREIGERHYCTVLSYVDGSRKYRAPTAGDREAFRLAQESLAELQAPVRGDTSPDKIPNEQLSRTEPRRLNILHYGFENWGQVFNDRQKLCWVVFSQLLQQAFVEIEHDCGHRELSKATSTILGLTLSNLLQYNCSMSTWLSDGMISVFIQSSSIPMRADYAEANPLMLRLVGGYQYQLERTIDVLSQFRTSLPWTGNVALSSATKPVLPYDSVDALITDPPYYFAIPYAELSDFFYVWLKRFLRPLHEGLFITPTTPKADEAIQNLPHSQAVGQKDRQHFETKMYESLVVARNEVKPSGIAIVVFAHASTEGWESLLNALLRADWIITGSWPIDTERAGRMLASRQRSLASSVHLACRPRENPDGSVRVDKIGDWRDVLQELPRRIHEWMPRLAEEGIVGADAIFACLGPALEIFSRYSRVEKASGEVVTLKEYMEQVWAAVAKEALSLVFRGADASGFEEDARLTAMWLWTLRTGESDGNGVVSDEESEEDHQEEDGNKKGKDAGFALEYDAARKIAQGLGAHLENLTSLVEIKGDIARLLPVAERTRALFGKDEAQAPGTVKRKKEAQLKLGFEAELKEVEESGGWGQKGSPRLGNTALDRVHQAMILFATGRGEALRRFLVDEGVGRDERFWRLAQALSALYPSGTDERRWVEGVQARKKALRF